jgi:YfiH family protein
VCVVMVADCLPVLLADDKGSVVAVTHAGWRGLAAGVIERTIAEMQVAPPTLAAFLGPCIGGSAYEVGDEVRAAFCAYDAAASEAFAPKSDGKWLANLPLLARQRLTRAGLHDVRIAGGAWCTFSDPARFYSYRRDGASGRMAALIWRDA